MTASARRIRAIDSHTAGEPTRVVIEGGPDLGRGPLAQRLERLGRDHDDFRSAVVNEPRGSDALVGALLCEPHDPTCDAGVIFFDNVTYLGMCGHGTIGLVITLAQMGRAKVGAPLRIETPVGVVTAKYLGDNRAAVRNIPARRSAAGVAVEVDGVGRLRGDVAWGGNWFYLVEEHGLRVAFDNLERLTDATRRIRAALERAGLCGDDGREIDHVVLFGPPSSPAVADSRNFVLCPGLAYDRSPCGTGTSARVACLVADGRLQPGQVWRQEGIVGGVFEASVEIVDGQVVPTIVGSAHITAETTLILDPRDPFAAGIRPAGIRPARPMEPS